MDPQLQRLIKDPMFRHGEALTIGYLIGLRNYATPSEMFGVNEKQFRLGLTLGNQARMDQALLNEPVPFFLGYYSDEELPIKKGHEITIPAGTRIIHRGETKVSAKTRKVTVDHIISGSNLRVRNGHREGDLHTITAPKVRWAGSGGYWSEVDINDVPEALEAAKEAQRENERLAQASLVEVQIQKLAEVMDQIRKDFDANPERWPFPSDGFNLRVHSAKADYFQVDAVTEGLVIASFTVDTYVDAGKIGLRINVTSSICQPLSGARLIFKALCLLMSQAEHIDSVYCQPWNRS